LVAASGSNAPMWRRRVVGAGLAVVLAAAGAARADGPTAQLRAEITNGIAPLPTNLDARGSSAGAGQTIGLELVFPGNGDLVAAPAGGDAIGYTYLLPGYYGASSWIVESPSGAFAGSAPVGISARRLRDGVAAPRVDVVLAHTTDVSVMAFLPMVTPIAGVVEVGHHWDFGDGAGSGEDSPLHRYPQPGLYQATYVLATAGGLLSRVPLLVDVGDASGGAARRPPFLVGVTPGDAKPSTPVTLVAYIVGKGLTVTRAAVAWPDLVDAAPEVTPTPFGAILTSPYQFADPGSYDIPVTVQLDGVAAQLDSVAHVSISLPDGGAPSPVLLARPAAEVEAGVAYEPNGSGARAQRLLIAGNGPFAFGVAAPSPRNVTIDDDGTLRWVPSAGQVGTQRLAVTVTDEDGQSATFTWVVAVRAGSSSACDFVPGAPASSSPWLLVILAAGLAVRRRRRPGREATFPQTR
jgi:MYXO-CTERM domain-containing protein